MCYQQYEVITCRGARITVFVCSALGLYQASHNCRDHPFRSTRQRHDDKFYESYYMPRQRWSLLSVYGFDAHSHLFIVSYPFGVQSGGKLYGQEIQNSTKTTTLLRCNASGPPDRGFGYSADLLCSSLVSVRITFYPFLGGSMLSFGRKALKRRAHQEMG